MVNIANPDNILEKISHQKQKINQELNCIAHYDTAPSKDIVAEQTSVSKYGKLWLYTRGGATVYYELFTNIDQKQVLFKGACMVDSGNKTPLAPIVPKTKKWFSKKWLFNSTVENQNRGLLKDIERHVLTHSIGFGNEYLRHNIKILEQRIKLSQQLTQIKDFENCWAKAKIINQQPV